MTARVLPPDAWPRWVAWVRGAEGATVRVATPYVEALRGYGYDAEVLAVESGGAFVGGGLLARRRLGLPGVTVLRSSGPLVLADPADTAAAGNLLEALAERARGLRLAPRRALPNLSGLVRGRLRFDAGWNGMELAQVLTGLPCPLHDEGTYRVSLARCRIDLERVLTPSDLPSRVRNLLGAHFDQVASGRGHGARAPQLPDLARQLHMSPRTLIRQLALQQNSYRELLEEQQCKLARELLARARYRVADVGELLGFADPAIFSRAFRRWTGQSPGAFRRS